MLATLLVLAGLTVPACNGIAPISSPPAIGRRSPTFWVAAELPGATAQEMQRDCVQKIEAEIAAIPEVTRIVSNITDGRAEMAIWARESTARRIFRQKLLIALEEVAPRLPDRTEGPRLLNHDPLGTLIDSPPPADFQAGDVNVYLDEAKVSELGLTKAAVLEGIDAAPDAAPDQTSMRQYLAELPVRVDDQTTVPLGRIAEIRVDSQPRAIIRVWPGEG
jgi:Cu/Ag efflux pump CusA